MKKLFSAFLIMQITAFAHAQSFSVSNNKLNVAYAGIPNPITIAVENYKANQIIVSTDNGTLVGKGNGKYDYTPLNTGKANIKIKVKTKNGIREIGETAYRIKETPRPIAYVYLISRGCIYVYKPQAVRARLDNFDFDIFFKVTDFKIDIYRNNKIVFSGVNTGEKFAGNIAEAIGQMYPKDRMHIYEIHCVGPNKKILLLNEIIEGYQ